MATLTRTTVVRLATAAVLGLALAACAPTNPEQWMERELQACVPTAIAFRQGLKRQDVWAEVFLYRYTGSDGKPHGHAMVAYMYPPGANKLWTYDNLGSWRIRAYKDDLPAIARESHHWRYGQTSTYSSEWIK